MKRRIQPQPTSSAHTASPLPAAHLAPLILGGLSVVPSALLVLGTHLPKLPYLGLLGTYLVPLYAPWAVVLPAAGSALSLWASRGGRPQRAARLLGGLGAVAALGSAVVLARMVGTARANGVHIDLLNTFGTTKVDARSTATPDDTVTYSTHDGQPLELDVYRPRNGRSGLAPVLVNIHGGGWSVGDRLNRRADMGWFAEQGWLVVSIGYTLSTAQRNMWNDVHGQVACALAWVAQNAERYGGDSARLSMIGDSAGGNLAINTAYMANQGSLVSPCGGTVPRISAVSTAYPAVDPALGEGIKDPLIGTMIRTWIRNYAGGTPEQFPDRYQAIASATHLSPAAPPTLMIVPVNDDVVPPHGTYAFAEQAGAAGVEVRLIRMPYANHVFDSIVGNVGDQLFRHLTRQWLERHGQAPVNLAPRPFYAQDQPRTVPPSTAKHS